MVFNVFNSAVRPVAAPKAAPKAAPTQPTPVAAVPAATRNGTRPAPATSAGTSQAASKSNEALRNKLEKQKLKTAELEKMAQEIEKQRSFYVYTLQKLQGLVQKADQLKATTIGVNALKKVLYEGNEEPSQEETGPAAAENGNPTLERSHQEALLACPDDIVVVTTRTLSTTLQTFSFYI